MHTSRIESKYKKKLCERPSSKRENFHAGDILYTIDGALKYLFVTNLLRHPAI